MNRYRFKTKEEFELIGRWNDEYDCPVDWNEGGEMNEYLGQEILNSHCIALCESNDEFKMDSWTFLNHDYVIIEEETVDKNLLIECSSEKEHDEVFDHLESLGELTNRNKYSFKDKPFNLEWYFVGFHKEINNWTVARKSHISFGDKVISAKEFLNKSETTDNLLEQAKRMYPVGTKFYPAHVNVDSKSYCIVTNDRFYDYEDGISALTDEGTSFSFSDSLKYGTTTMNRNVYYKGKWAEILIEEIVKEEEVVTSLVGRWVKFLKQISSDQPIGSYDLIIEDDSELHIKLKKYRTCAKARFRDREIELMPEGWTPKEDLTGRWIKALKDRPQATPLKKGEITQLLEKGENFYKIKDNFGANPESTYDWEILPEDYSPEDDVQNKPIEYPSRFKIGDWIIWEGSYKSNPYQLVEIKDDGHIDQDGQFRDTKLSQYRLCTPDEIPKVSNMGKSFPTNWCLKIDYNNRLILDKWRRKQPDFYELVNTFKGWLTFDRVDGTYTNWSDNVPQGYVEITLQQFYDNVHPIEITQLINSKEAIKGTEMKLDDDFKLYPIFATTSDTLPTKKPLIEDVQSISVNLRTKKKINKLIF
jgi:hypothetical protein